MIHISEFSDKYVRSIDEYVSVGQRVKLKVLDVDEKAKRLKLSYKLLHKQRGVKGEVPKFIIGFKTLRKAIPDFITKELEKIKREPLKTNLLKEGKLKIKF